MDLKTNEMQTLTIPLYHGTSTLFLGSIIKHGLGGFNAMKEWKIFELAKEVYNLSEEHLIHTDLFKRSSASFSKMVNQSNADIYNWQHGETYLSSSSQTAARYAINKEYGSELLTYTLNFLNQLLKLNLSYVKGDLYRKYENVFALIEMRPAPILIEVEGVPKSSLIDELGNDPQLQFANIEDVLQSGVADPQLYLQRTNFRLVSPIPVSSRIKFWLIDVKYWHQFDSHYDLYEITTRLKDR
jgi:hypothetical protein